MEVHMQLNQSQQRGKFWPLLFGLLGALNIVDFFYKLAYQPDDLVQGLGFLLVVPLAYFVPAAFSFEPRTQKLQVRPAVKGMAVVGTSLVLAGFAFQLGWL